MARATVTRALLYTHRWLGLACCALFAMWFASGLVMMYARMPRLSAEERLLRLPPLDLSRATVTPAVAGARAGFTDAEPAERLRIGMIGPRPVYRFARGSAWRAVYADSGEPVEGLVRSEVLTGLAGFVPEHRATLRYDRRLDDSDQWTLSSVIRAQMPLHRVALGDGAGTEVYVSDRTGDIVMKTDARGRFWGYAGAVLHWIYFTPLRRRADLWNDLIVYGSLVGCLMCLSGLAAGLWRWSRVPRYRLRGAAAPSRSPYAGYMKWHHYGGLIFGVFTFTWILSGMLSMNPWDWSPGNSPTPEQRRVFAGGTLALSRLSVEQMGRALDRLRAVDAVKELEVVQFEGQVFYAAYRPPASPDAGAWSNTDLAAFLSPQTALARHLISADGSGVLFDRFDRTAVERVTRRTVPGARVVEAAWLDEYDAYYYDRARAKPLPVLRVKFDDPEQTWMYADPRSGTLVAREQRRTRLERWLYQGLHSLDVPGLYTSRPLWDLVVIGLSLGGLVVSGTAVVLGWRRGRRWVHSRGARPGRSVLVHSPASNLDGQR